jgi:hypothetical protein
MSCCSAPGVGKTHLAVALGLKACEHGVRVLFTTAAGLIATLGKALAEGRLDERLKILAQPQLLIIDEIGYIPIDRQGANLFFQLVSRRYERGAIILTSNQSLGIAERNQEAAGRRVKDKDALDVLRILRSIQTEMLVNGLRSLLADPLSDEVTREATTHLAALFGSASAAGTQMVMRATERLEDPAEMARSCELLANDLLQALKV